MTAAAWEEWLGRWWRTQWDLRHGEPPSCRVCGDSAGLVLLRRTPSTGPAMYEDMIPLCLRCSVRTETVVAARCADGGRWHGMPRRLAVDTVVHELATGITPIDPAEDE